MQSSSSAVSVVTVEIEGKTTFTFSSDSLPSRTTKDDHFPGNESDVQFAAKLDGELDKAKYGCAYTGRHDHGTLPPQKRGSPHEETLLFLEQARNRVAEHILSMKASDNKGT